MEIKNKVNTKKFVIDKNIIEQKDIRLSKYNTIIEAVNDEEFYSNFEIESTVLVIAKDGKMFEFNVIGAVIWEFIKKKATFEEIENFLMKIFEVEKKQVQGDIKFFIDELISNNILN